ncbi:MAG: phosphoribosylamine--glycine ligase [Acidimicrobiales bacterium]
MSSCVVVGSGAREHALAWAMSKSANVIVTPGNAGIAAHGITCTSTPATTLDADLFVIGPEQPLVEGLADALRAQGKSVVGPGKDGAQLEGSKAFMKEFLAASGVPTAAFGSFRIFDDAVAYLRTMNAPYVIKTNGLAAGKGVLVTSDFEEACADVRDKLSGESFGDAGTTVIIEEGLDGPECSLLVLCDGTNVQPLAAAQDFKRVDDGDQGANTGGMGAYAPMPSMSASHVEEVMATILKPTVDELTRRSIDFRGVLYAGIMLTSNGPKLLEYNVRFGDPETEVLVPLYGDRLFGLLTRVANGSLGHEVAPTSQSAVTVVLASHGYPATSRHGDVISGLGPDGQLATTIDGVLIFHAGTGLNGLGQFVTAGGRVLAVTAVGDSLAQARRRAYEAASLITFEGKVMRTDIARDADEGEK